MVTSPLRSLSPVQVVRPMLGLAESARAWTISAAVWPWMAQWILFCTVWKKSLEVSVLGS